MPGHAALSAVSRIHCRVFAPLVAVERTRKWALRARAVSGLTGRPSAFFANPTTLRPENRIAGRAPDQRMPDQRNAEQRMPPESLIPEQDAESLQRKLATSNAVEERGSLAKDADWSPSMPEGMSHFAPHTLDTIGIVPHDHDRVGTNF